MNNKKYNTVLKYTKIIFITLSCLFGVIAILQGSLQAIAIKPSTAKAISLQSAAASTQQTGNFEAMPPIATKMYLQKLPGSDSDFIRVLLSVQLHENEQRFKSNAQFSMQLNERTKVTFSDQGENGDIVAKDGVFSTSLNFSNREFTQLIDSNNQRIRMIDVQTDFFGRSIVRRPLQLFRINDFNSGRPVPFTFVSSFRVNANNIDDLRKKSLMVTDFTVVDDLDRTYDPCRKNRAGLPNKGQANGPWSFKTLMDNIANTPVTGVPTKDFVVEWVDKFLFNASTHSISTDSAPSRTAAKERFIKAWMRNSGLTVPPQVPANWQSLNLKVEEFPVRLLAIVNRLDLRGNHGYGTLNNTGEGRLVFSFVDSNQNCSINENSTGVMTFIFEYSIPIGKCDDLQAYASKWWDLHQHPFGSSFNSKLADITNVFTASNTTDSNPNKSALKHLRTNEFLTQPWNIRDFELDPQTKKLTIVHPDKEPMERSNGFDPRKTAPQKLQDLVTFVNRLSFVSGNPVYTIPDPIAGMHAPMNNHVLGVPASNGSEQSRFHWRGNATHVMTPVNRREFSLNTCSGCHTGETATPFTHIHPRQVGANSRLSGFMTGLGPDDFPIDNDNDPLGGFIVNDPGRPTLKPKEFNQALERANSLERLVFNSPCSFQLRLTTLEKIVETLSFNPTNSPH